MRRLGSLLALTTAVLVAALHVGSALASDAVFTATGSPSFVAASHTDSYTITVTNQSTHINVKQATIDIPAGFTVDPSTVAAVASPPASGSCTNAGSWSFDGISGGTINLHHGSDPSNELCTGGMLTVTFSAASPAAGGSSTWAVGLRRDDTATFSGSSPAVLVDSPPTCVNATHGLVVAPGLPVVTCSDPDIVAGDSLSYSVVSGPSHGTLTGGGPGYSYSQSRGFLGTDSFMFMATDSFGAASNVATLSLQVLPEGHSLVTTPATGAGGSSSTPTRNPQTPLGPPGVTVLGGSFTPPLAANLSGRDAFVSVEIALKNVKLLKVSAHRARSKRLLRLLKGSMVGTSVTGRPRTVIYNRPNGLATVRIRLKISKSQLQPGKRHLITVVSIGADGQTSTLEIPFRG